MPILFFRVAKFLVEQNLARPFLVDYEDGMMARLINDDKQRVTLVPYSDDTVTCLPEDAIVVFQSMTPWSIFPNLKVAKEAKIFFWNCHPFNLVTFFPGFRFLAYKFPRLNRMLASILLHRWFDSMQSFIGLLDKRRAIAFMDETNWENTNNHNRYKVEHPQFLPIPVEVGTEVALCKAPCSGPGLRITWIGRIVDFKFYPFKRFLLSINEVSKALKIPVSVSIIGSGPAVQELQETISGLDAIDCRFLGEKALEDMRGFLDNHTDILVAMGTSALEGAARGVATILLDLSYRDVPANYRYKWLFQTTGYNLAEVISSKHSQGNNQSLTELITDYLEQPDKFGTLCAEYVNEHHRVETVAKRLTDMAAKSELKWQSIEPFMKPISFLGFSPYLYLRMFRNRTP